MSKIIDSPVFGKTEIADGEAEEALREMINRYPVSAFGLVNKKLNERGLCLCIDALPDKRELSS
jgi:hypothetical protein